MEHFFKTVLLLLVLKIVGKEGIVFFFSFKMEEAMAPMASSCYILALDLYLRLC